MRCPNCGTNNRPGAKFCRQCATRLIGAATPGSAAPGQAPPAASLVVQRGPQAGQTFTLHAGTNTVGRAPGNDVLLSEGSVSRSHARITVQPEGVWIEDLGSTSGTFVNNQRTTGSTWLQAGDTVQIGGSVILGVQVAVTVALAIPAAPPPVVAPTAAAPPVAGVPAAPARRPKRRRRSVLVGGLIGASALVVLAIVGTLYVRPLLSGGLQLPNVGDWSAMTEDGASAIGVSVMEQRYPELADVAPAVTEAQVQGHRVYDVIFSPNADVEDRGFTRIVIIAIDTESETISVFESN
jgi:hypothetical protein